MRRGDKTVVLGEEHDAALLARVREVLRELGATLGEERWAMAGSQEISTLDVELDGASIRIEAETYVGLSLIGPAAQVDRIAARVAALTARDRP